MWSANGRATPRPLPGLDPADRRFLAATSLPETLSTPDADPDEEAIAAAVRGRFNVSARHLEAMDIKAPMRSRSRDRLKAALDDQGLDFDEYLGTFQRNDHSPPRVCSDVVELLRAAINGDWSYARRLLEVAAAPVWKDATPDGTPSIDAITRKPVLVAPAVLPMLERAIAGALQDPLPTDPLTLASAERAPELVPEPAPAPEDSRDAEVSGPDHREDYGRLSRLFADRRVVVMVALALVAVAVVGAVLLLRDGSDDPAPKPPTSVIYAETTGGPADVHKDYKSLQGVESQAIGQGDRIQVACRVRGVKVGPSHNPWWYLIAAPERFRGRYVTADAFYNNGQVDGPIKNTPLVDPRVQQCQ